MQHRVMFKTNDAVYLATASLPEQDAEQVRETAAKFVKYDEYVTIEFDTEKGTATVVPL